MKTFREYLQEGNPLARVVKHAADRRHFVSVSAQRSHLSKKDNEKRHKELKKKVSSQGYGYRETEGHWEGGKEKSLMVHAKGAGNKHGAQLHKDMVAHAKHYDQDSILHHTGKTGVLKGTNKTGFPGEGKTSKVGSKMSINPPKSDYQTSLRTKKHAKSTFAIEGNLKQISDEEFIERQDKFFEEQGPNPGDGFFGAWGWTVAKQREFRDLLRSEGYAVDFEEMDEDISDEEFFNDENDY